MEAFGSGGNEAIWGMLPFHFRRRSSRRRPTGDNRRSSKPSGSDSLDFAGGSGYRFPLKQAITAASLALTGDTFAQIRNRWINLHQNSPSDLKDITSTFVSEYDWLRAIRMTAYGFLLYGPGSYAWYQTLDRCMPEQTVQNLLIKVLLNQIVLGPCVIAVVFAWNNLWRGKLSELPSKYQKDAIPTLLFGFRFWIPVSLLNFWLVPLQARVAFMSMGSIFWNFWLSSTMSK